MELTRKELSADLVVVGGGISGVCAVIAAARNGASVILVQDRPMLGGNASSEVRMHICGAYGKYENYGPENREGGILHEILLENYYLNPTLRYTIWDDVLYTFIKREKNITLLLNTTVNEVNMNGKEIESVNAWGLVDYTLYTISGKFFTDCSGDSILRLSGAEYRTGREASSEFGESFAPKKADKKTMGNTILIQLRKTDVHRPFIAPEWAYHYTEKTIRRAEMIQSTLLRPNFWWLEYGGIKDTIADAAEIQEELLKIAYGVWEYIKNHPNGQGKNWELDWVGKLPGKRENVRYVGDYILTQGDIEKLGNFEDIIGHGGWPMDDHHPEAFYAEKPSTIYNTTPACYGIPYRILYSKNIDNLFFAGRNVSCTHLGMSSTRVMGTCAVMGQAVGSAVAIAVKEKTTPREIYTHHIEELQDILMEQDQFIPFLDRKISSLSLLSKISHEVLRSRMDRFYDDEDNGIWIKLGESCYYEFDNLEKVFSARIIFDSDFTDRKCMPVTEGVEEDDIKSIPGTIARDFVLEYRKDGTWKQVAKIKENRKRYCRIDFDSVEADAFRLIPLRSWNENADSIHLFNFEVN